MKMLKDHPPWRQWIFFIAIGAVSFALRFYYVTHAQVLQPVNQANVRGDAVEYYRYASNLVNHQTFSISPEVEKPLVRDSYRDPGYPLFMAAWMRAFPDWNVWYAAMLLSQSVLGSLTVLLLLGTGSSWMPAPWLAAAGILMSVWPHSVVITSVLLTETLVGFLSAAGLFILRLAIDRDSRGWAAISGAFLSLAGLTNAVMLPAAGLLAVYLAARGKMRYSAAACLIASALALSLPWIIRNVSLPSGNSTSTNRAMTNLVQGSWPIFQSSYRAAMQGNPNAKIALTDISNEATFANKEPVEALQRVSRRIADHPGFYLKWYLSKPALLWSWDIQIGQGDIYIYPTRNSPFKTSIFFRVIAAVCHSLNWIIFFLMVLGCLRAFLPKQGESLETASVSLTLLFVTSVYSLLQAEPRYSAPFRGMEIMLATFTAYCGTCAFKHRKKNKNRHKPISDRHHSFKAFKGSPACLEIVFPSNGYVGTECASCFSIPEEILSCCDKETLLGLP
jgi:hypothetical protein